MSNSSDGNNLTFTTGTDSGNILSFTTNTTWDFFENFDMWPRGVQDPSTEMKYFPKWHITLGYRIQMPRMWD